MSKSTTPGKIELINDLIIALNEKRAKEGLKPVRRGWTGAAHWLHLADNSSVQIGSWWTTHNGFIGFLNGLLVEQYPTCTYLVYTCDQWHSHSSREVFGAYVSADIAIANIKKSYKLSDDDTTNLAVYNQTQGRETNFLIEKLEIQKG